MTSTEQLSYPIGRFVAQSTYTAEQIAELIENFSVLPDKVATIAKQLDEKGLLETAYRPGGWTARQVIHHLADSHLNAYQRIKLTLTEDHPTLRPYDEKAWACLADYTHCYFVSQHLLENIHQRLVICLKAATPQDWLRTCHHPTNASITTLAHLLATYDWHGRHHLSHLALVLNSATA